MTSARELLSSWLDGRLDERGLTWLSERRAELAAGVDDTRFASLVSLASRFTPRVDLAPSEEERAAAFAACAGWNPERWTLLEAVRVDLVLGHSETDGFERALEEAFRFADDGELRALYKSLALLPDGGRFAWRAKEGCRTNIVPVFESIACDNGYPLQHFDDVAWNQLCIKAVFIGAPLWRVHGLDERLSPELARIALDLAEERRSAGREVQHELWLCLGTHGGDRARQSMEHEFDQGSELGRRAVAFALARAGLMDRVGELAESESDPGVERALRDALEGRYDQGAFRALDQRT